MNSERHLLLGLLAFQNGFISQVQLLFAFGTWVSDKSRGLADYLTDQKALSTDVVAALERMVELHLVRFGGDPEKSLASLSIVGSSLRTELEQLAIGDNQALHTISFLAPICSSASSARQDKYETVNVLLSRGSGGNQDIAPFPVADSQRFRIVHQHAKGGLGVIFVAEDQQLHRKVALKQIRDDRADVEEYRSKFEQEAQITGQLEHPGIVPIYALGTNESGRPYYAMRFILGEDLQSRIRKFHTARKDQKTAFDGPELRGLLRRFVDVCNAIDYAHDRGVLHRDLKPGNIMLGKHGETLVVDWGLAKAMANKSEVDPYSTMGILSELPISKAETGSGTETRYGQFIGTPAYAPPEQMLGQLDKLGPASDVYSLGAIMYELLTGKVPISGTAIVEFVAKCTSGDYPNPRKLDNGVPRPLDAICCKAMSLKTEDRFASAKLLRDEIERWLANDPVMTYRESVLERFARWLRLHQAFVTGFAATLVLGFVSAIGIAVLIAGHSVQLGDAVTKANEETAKALASERLATASEEKALESQKKSENSQEEAMAKLARSKYFLASSRWNENREEDALELMEQIPIGYRNFEWRLRQQEFEGGYATLHSRFGTGLSIEALHASDDVLKSANIDGRIQQWDTRTGIDRGQLSLYFDDGETKKKQLVTGLRLTSTTFCANGYFVAIAMRKKELLINQKTGKEGSIVVFDLRTGDEINRFHT